MTGILIASVAPAAASTHRVTIGSAGGGAGVVGFVSGTALGAFTPNAYRGLTVLEASTGNAYDFFFLLQATVAQSFFSQILVQDGAGVWVTFNSASATFSNASPPFSQWEWGTGSGRPWTAANAGANRNVTLLQ